MTGKKLIIWRTGFDGRYAEVYRSALFDRVDDLLRDIDYRRENTYGVELRGEGDDVKIRVGMWRPDTYTEQMGWGYGGWYRVSSYATDSEIVQAVFGLFKAYEEHECREAFTWRDRRIFGPHIHIDSLHHAAATTDARKDVRA